MASLITVRLYNEDNTPKIGATPLISAIKQSDKSIVLDKLAMEEVGEGFYQFEFTDYSNMELYFFFIDGEVYDDVNVLDSYGNKNTRGRNPNVILDTKELAKDVRDAKATEHKKEGTMGAVVQKPISFVEIILELNKLQGQAETLATKITDSVNSNTILAVKGEIGKIKKIDYDKIEDMIETKVNPIGKKLDEIKEELEEEEEETDDEANIQLQAFIGSILEGINEINRNLEGMSRNELQSRIIELVDKTSKENLDKIASVGINLSTDINILKKGITNLSSKLSK